jgi:hypothetical protein
MFVGKAEDRSLLRGGAEGCFTRVGSSLTYKH